MRIMSWAICLVCLLCFSPVQAQPVTLMGKTNYTGHISRDREAAIMDAIKAGMLSSGASLKNQTRMENGVLTADITSMRSHGNLSSVQILDEWHDETYYQVKISAEINSSKGSSENCSDPSAPEYSRLLLINRIENADLKNSQIGRLQDIDSRFAKDLARRLYENHGMSINSDKTAEREALTIRELAKKTNSQFIISGSILDTSLINPAKYFEKSTAHSFNKNVDSLRQYLFGKDKDDHRSRVFSFSLQLKDGITGTVVFDKTYHTQGIWDVGYAEAVGFGSPKFWQTNYGQSVNTLMQEAATELSNKVQCQPFMVRSRYLPNEEKLHLFVGANQGIKRGDMMTLFFEKQLNYIYALDPKSANQPLLILKDMDISVSITQVYPDYSLASPNKPLHSEAYDGDYRYIAISW